MKILVTNDDGYQAPGIHALVRILRKFGDLVIVAPKQVQSGMGMAVSMGYVPIAVKKVEDKPGEQWWYLDGTPASCVKFGIDNIMFPEKPDLVVSGINHGSNAATAAVYSGTVGAAMEGAINGIPSIAVSLDNFLPSADFSAVEKMLPHILERIIENFSTRFGAVYNINFPNLKAEEIKGVRICNMGKGHWEREYEPYSLELMDELGHHPRMRDLWYINHTEEGESLWVMKGDFVSNEGNAASADHLLLERGYVTITPHNLDNTDYDEFKRLCAIIL